MSPTVTRSIDSPHEETAADRDAIVTIHREMARAAAQVVCRVARDYEDPTEQSALLFALKEHGLRELDQEIDNRNAEIDHLIAEAGHTGDPNAIERIGQLQHERDALVERWTQESEDLLSWMRVRRERAVSIKELMHAQALVAARVAGIRAAKRIKSARICSIRRRVGCVRAPARNRARHARRIRSSAGATADPDGEPPRVRLRNAAIGGTSCL